MTSRLPALVALLFLAHALPAQQRANSAALKSYRSPEAPAMVRPYDETAKLWQDFMLVRDANAGDAASQHELGLRYLFGEGFTADTVKAAHWIAMAAAQRLPTACFNYGILLNNGWGTPWDPFKAYDEFEYAALHGVPEGEYAYGLFLLDNLAVPRDEAEARCWIRASADTAYAPAVQLFAELDRRKVGVSPASREKKGKKSVSPSVPAPGGGGSLGLIYLDFNQDTSAHVSDDMLVEDLAASPADSAVVARSAPPSAAAIPALDTAGIGGLEALSRPGNPEALALLGRWFERRATPDPVRATLAYERAVRFDSPRAPELLWNLTRSKGYFDMLRAAVDRGSADAEVAWAILAALGFDHQITDEQAFEFLTKAAAAGHPQAMIELGLCALTGRWTAQDRERGLAWWRRAADLGSEEAAIRLISTQLLTPGDDPPGTAQMDRLREASRLGAVQAELALAYARETGRGAEKDIPAAVRSYRAMAQRGNRVAYESLRRMYDALRPKARPEFEVAP